MRTELMRYAALAVVSEKPLDKIMYMYMSMGKRFDIQRIWATPIPKYKEGIHQYGGIHYYSVDSHNDIYLPGSIKTTKIFPKQVILRP